MPTKEEISAVRAGMQSMNIHQNDSVASLVSISDSCSSSSSATFTFDEDLQQQDSLLDDVDIIEEQVVDTAPTLLCQRDDDDRRDEQLVKDKQHTCSTNKCTISNRDDAPQRKFGINFLRPRQWNLKQARRRSIDSKVAEKVVIEASFSTQQKEEQPSEKQQQQHPTRTEKRPSILQNIVDDFTPNKGDQKILRAIGRTATVNAAVLLTAATGGAAGAIGYATGGAITTKRLVDGIVAEDEKEITKSLAVYGCATGASIAGQALAGALMIGVAGASLPLAGVVAFGVGCVSGISAGAVSEWTVDSLHDIGQQREKKFMKKEVKREVVKGSVEASSNDRDIISADGTTTISARRWLQKRLILLLD